MAKLTKRTIDATAPVPGRDVLAWDDELPGFGIRIKPSGARSFIVQSRNRNGRSRRVTIGRYGVVTPEEARRHARLALAGVLRGEDPADQQIADRQATTVADLCREYLDRAERGLVITRRKQPPERLARLIPHDRRKLGLSIGGPRVLRPRLGQPLR